MPAEPLNEVDHYFAFSNVSALVPTSCFRSRYLFEEESAPLNRPLHTVLLPLLPPRSDNAEARIGRIRPSQRPSSRPRPESQQRKCGDGMPFLEQKITRRCIHSMTDAHTHTLPLSYYSTNNHKSPSTATGSSPAPTFSILIGNATNPGPYTGGNAASSGAASSTVTTSSPSGTLTGTVSAVSSGSATSTGVAGVGANAAGVSSEASGVAAAENASSSSASTTPTGAAVSGVAGLSPVLVSAMACGAALLSVVAV